MSIQTQLIKSYIKEKRHLLIAYILGVALLILFFFLESKGRLIVAYPSLLTGFVLLVFICFDFNEFQKKHKLLESLKADRNNDLPEYNDLFCIVNDINQLNRQERLTIERANEENNQILSQWIHHMKTPISVIDLIIQKLDEGYDVSKHVSDLREENSKLHTRLEQVLTLTRLKGFHQDFEPACFDVVPVIKSMINENKRLFIYHSVFPKFEETREIHILSDEKWFRIMIDQILVNAIKYSKKNEEPSYVILSLDIDEQNVTLKIKDNGIGIEEYDLNKVFNPFFTGDNGRKERNSSGIGLYICHRIAQELGHRIDIQSTVDTGTEVRIKCLTRL